MNLSDLGNIGEFVGAIAVVVSMVYLAVQVRRNTQSLDASIDHTYVDLYLGWVGSFSSEKSSKLLVAGFDEPANLTDAEAARFGSYMVRLIVLIEVVYSMYSRGTLSKERWEVAKTDILTFLGTRGGRLWWKGNKSGFPLSIVQVIDEVLKNPNAVSVELSDWRNK